MEYPATFLTKPFNFLCYNDLDYNQFDFIYSHTFVLSTVVHSDKNNKGKKATSLQVVLSVQKGLIKVFVLSIC